MASIPMRRPKHDRRLRCDFCGCGGDVGSLLSWLASVPQWSSSRSILPSQLPAKRMVQQRLEEVLRVAVGFALLGAQVFESVYALERSSSGPSGSGSVDRCGNLGTPILGCSEREEPIACRDRAEVRERVCHSRLLCEPAQCASLVRQGCVCTQLAVG